MKRDDELEVTLENFAFEGKSVTRIDGLVIFVHGGVPGDTVRIRITKTKKKFAEAESLGVITPSPLRVEPRCRYFGTCGGCKWQNVAYQAQLDFKRQNVLDALERIGGFRGIIVNPTLGSDATYYYRNKMEFSFGDRWRTREEMTSPEGQGSTPESVSRFALGLHIPERFDKVLDVHECWLQSEVSAKILNTIRDFCLERKLPVYSTLTHEGYLRNVIIREGGRTGERMVNVVTYDERPEVMEALTLLLLREHPSITTVVNNVTRRMSQVAIGDTERTYHGPGSITEKIGTRTYRISANSFFQTNTLQAERLYDVARKLAGFQKTDLVFDLYSGTGTIALHVADDVREVVGIESVESAVEDAKRNASTNGVANCTFVLGDLKEKLTKDTRWLARYPRPDVVILDPPRAGVHEKVITEVLALAPRRIVYVSCNPGTQARDLKLMCEKGQYAITEVQPVDMFPHTYHVENVAALSRT